MGRYVDQIPQPGEKVLYSTNAHWIFHLPATGEGRETISTIASPLQFRNYITAR